jgi:Kef-type K+ transport system membrane component KefB
LLQAKRSHQHVPAEKGQHHTAPLTLVFILIFAFSLSLIEPTTRGGDVESHSAVSLFLALGIIIAASRFAGAFTRFLGQPRVLGELLIGVILGPTLLGMLQWPVLHGADLQPTIHGLAELGVLLLMFIVGLEVELSELTEVGRVAVIAGVAGALVPVALTVPVVMMFGYHWEPALFAGVTLAATSVSISAQVLLELGFLRTKVGSALLATALIDDVVAILLVSLTIAITGPQGNVEAGTLVSIILRMALYIAGAFLLSWFVLPRVVNWIADNPRLSQSYGVPAFALILALVFAWSAEEWGGIAAITGAFIAGIGLSRTRERVKHTIEEAMGYIAYAFLVPIFFIDVGLQTDLSTFPLSALPLALLLLGVGLVSKIAGCGYGAKLGGFNREESLRLGVCMISRGEVGLIIAALGLSSGILQRDDPLFASLFLVILLTTVLAPPLVRLVFRKHDGQERPVTEGAATS